MSSAPSLSPFVYWGQTKDQITLTVALQEVEDPVVELTDESISFTANGEGLQGFRQYQFSIDFHQEIDEKKSKYRVTAKNVEFQLIKKTRVVWPRLTYSNQKPQWLKVNFDQFAFEDELSSSSDDDAEREKQFREEFVKREAEALHKRELNSFRIFYLFIYNLFMFVGYTYITIGLILNYYELGEAGYQIAFKNYGGQMMMLQAMSILEVIHPLFGVVKTGFIAPLAQFSGRGFILFIVLYPNGDVHTHSVVWWLFLSWGIAEFARYPYYMAKSYDWEFGLITYIRYTAWIVLYPAGFFCEGLTMLESLHFFDETGYWSLELPNQANMSFNFPAFLRMYMLALFPLGLFMINHMYVQRKKKISPNIWKRQQAKKSKLNKGPLVFSQKVQKAD